MIKHGIDVVEEKRFSVSSSSTSHASSSKDRVFFQKVFHPTELKVGKLCSIFALKEATFKALGILPKWLEVEIKYPSKGKPVIVLSDKLKPKNLVSIDSSVSHEAGLVFASVVILLDEEK